MSAQIVPPSLARAPHGTAHRPPGRGARVQRRPASGKAATSGRWGLVAGVVLALGCSLAALTGLGSLASLAYPAATSVVAGALLLRRRDAAYLEFVLWAWLLSPEVRRIVDYVTGWHSLSPVMVAAPAATLIAIVPALRRVGRMHREFVALFSVVGVALSFGVAVGVIRNGTAATAADVLQWVPPFALGLWIANAGPATALLRVSVLRTALCGTLTIGGYGLVQFFILPAWDRAWMLAAPLASIGRPEPLQVRIYSVLNSPGPMALVVMSFVLVLISSRSKLGWLAHALGVMTLALSLVRAAWIGVLLGAGALLFRLRGRLLKLLVLDVVLLTVVIALVPSVQDLVLGRFDASVASGAKDESFAARLTFHETMLPIVLRDPIGAGLGAVGVATKAGNSGALGANGDFDGGALQLLFTFGALVGSAFLLVLLIAVRRGWQRTRTGDDFTKACGAAVLAMVTQLLFGNAFTSVSGIVLWLLLGILARAPEPADVSAAGVDG